MATSQSQHTMKISYVYIIKTFSALKKTFFFLYLQKHSTSGNSFVIPSFSPENKPLGYKSAITANAAMDIAAAVDSLNMYKNILSNIKPNGYQKTLEKITHLISCLPVYMFDKSGAIKEWSMNEYKENNAHRHISHLYCAWPSSETQHNHALASACRQAINNRNRETTGKDDTAGFTKLS